MIIVLMGKGCIHLGSGMVYSRGQREYVFSEWLSDGL